MKNNQKETILVVDDSSSTLEVIERNLTSRGFRVFSANGVSAALEILNKEQIDLVVTDLKMPKINGIELVRHVRNNFRNTGIMMITGYPSIESAVQAVKAGAEEYLSKPFTDDELLNCVDKVLAKLRTLAKTTVTPENPLKKYGIIGFSDAMHDIYESISKASAANVTTLIYGESGTGKELAARAIHYMSPRKSAPFVPINCSAIPDNLLESELFGYVKGAFTGAETSRAGFFQTAQGGTIFLDEISDTPPAMQAKLLRVIQEKEVCMIGSSKPFTVDVRVVAATNKDLFSMVQKGLFREDLYYRLNVINISLPSLKNRPADIIPLIGHFSAKFSKEFEKPLPVFSDDALDILRSYSWPGNIRELENTILRLMVMGDSEMIRPAHLPAHMRFSLSFQSGFTRPLEDIESEYITNVLASVDGNKSKAADILKISRKTLREKLKKSGSTDTF